MSKPRESEAAPTALPSFEIVGLVQSDFMPISVDGRQVDLAHATPEVTAWLHERKDKLPWLNWK